MQKIAFQSFVLAFFFSSLTSSAIGASFPSWPLWKNGQAIRVSSTTSHIKKIELYRLDHNDVERLWKIVFDSQSNTYEGLSFQVYWKTPNSSKWTLFSIQNVLQKCLIRGSIKTPQGNQYLPNNGNLPFSKDCIVPISGPMKRTVVLNGQPVTRVENITPFVIPSVLNRHYKEISKVHKVYETPVSNWINLHEVQKEGVKVPRFIKGTTIEFLIPAVSRWSAPQKKIPLKGWSSDTYRNPRLRTRSTRTQTSRNIW